MKSFKNFCAASFFLLAGSCFAGIDISGTLTGVQQAPDGNLYFGINANVSGTYCAEHWVGLNMFVPATDPNYSYYYGLLMLALSKAKVVYIGNIGIYNGTIPCDVTKTGYGIFVNP